jgi:uncharacterized protein
MSFKLLVVQPTSLCNLNCSYCYVPERKDKTRLDIDKITKFVDNVDFKDSSNLEILWHAGEPLTVGIDYFKEVTERVKEILSNKGIPESNVSFTIQTNATLITDQWADFFAAENYNIGVSIDGPQHLNDKNRLTWSGKGSYSKAIRGISLLRKSGIEPGIIMVISSESMTYPYELWRFIKKMDFKSVAFNVEEVENENTHSSLNDVQEAVFKEFLKVIYDLWEGDKYAVDIREFSDIIRSVKELQKNEFYVRSPLEVQLGGIATMDKHGFISVYSPELAGIKDERYNDFQVGDYSTDYNKIDSNQRYNEISNLIAESRNMCMNTCEYFNLCGGGFFSNKYFENGTLASTETTACRHKIKYVTDVLINELNA